ncbi:hypothetical protein JOM56_005710 [Amanita muscaria]
MSSFFKDKSKKPKADTGQKTSAEPPSIRVQETPPELPREASSFRRAMAKAKNLIVPSSFLDHFDPYSFDYLRFSLDLRTAVHLPEVPLRERREYLPVLDTTVIDDKDRSQEIKNDIGESLKPAGSVDRASEAAKVGAEDISANRPTVGPVAKDVIDKQSLQDAMQASNRQLQVMHTIGGGAQKAAEHGTQSTAVLDKADIAANFLKPLKAFDSVVKGLADVHPYAKVALSVLCWASQSRISDVYEFMLGDGQLEKMISMKDILSHASQVVYECAKFIQVYSQPNFCESVTSGMV